MKGAASAERSKKRRYVICYACLAINLGMLGISIALLVPWLGLVMVYPSATFAFVAMAYHRDWCNFMPKNARGRLALWSWIPFGPYYLFYIVIFRIFRLITCVPPYVEVLPNLYFGRRLTRAEAESACLLGWQGVLDLSEEMNETRVLRRLPGYRSFPVLDATAPPVDQLKEAVDWIARTIPKELVYVHCTFGHGRSACVVIGYLLSSGIVRTVVEGEQMLQKLRHGVRLNLDQLTVLETNFEPKPGSVESLPVVRGDAVSSFG
jgi:hypothetical protein